jgi:hypothetical protein
MKDLSKQFVELEGAITDLGYLVESFREGAAMLDKDTSAWAVIRGAIAAFGLAHLEIQRRYEGAESAALVPQQDMSAA